MGILVEDGNLGLRDTILWLQAAQTGSGYLSKMEITEREQHGEEVTKPRFERTVTNKGHAEESLEP